MSSLELQYRTRGGAELEFVSGAELAKLAQVYNVGVSEAVLGELVEETFPFHDALLGVSFLLTGLLRNAGGRGNLLPIS